MVRSRLLGAFALALVAAAAAVPGPGLHAMSDELYQELAAIAAVKGISIQEAARRHDLRERSSAAISAIVANPSKFADVFQDDSDGIWKLRIFYVGDAGEARASLDGLLPADLPVQWDDVTRSGEELRRIKADVIDMWYDIGLDRISEVSIDTLSNSVHVGLPAPDEGLSALLRDRYGDAVTTKITQPDQPGACNAATDPEGGSRYNCTPMRGGIRIDFNEGPCSTMMWGRNKTTGTRYIITAGHCGDLNQKDFFHNGAFVGRSNAISWTLASPRSDSRRIPTTGNNVQMNRVYETPSTKSYAITSVRGWGQQLFNDWVCKLGVGLTYFGRSCGVITNADTTIALYGKVIPAKAADFNGTNGGTGVSFGDSGGSVVYNNRIFGLVSIIGPVAKYPVARDVEHDMNVWLCLNADCSAP